MNSFSVSFTQNFQGAVSGRANNQRQADVSWTTGQTISALFASLDGDTATFRTTDDVVFTADASSVRGFVGQNLDFWVQRTRQGVKLTQVINDNSQVRAGRGVATVVDAFRGAINTLENMKETDELREEHRQEQAAKVAKAINSIRRAQNFASGNSNKTAVSAMIQSGLDISKVSFSDFNRVLHNADRTPDAPISETELKEGMDRDFSKPENAADIVTSLHKHGMNYSDRNVSAMENAWEKLPEKVEPPAIEKLVADEQELTLDNIYKSKYSAAPSAKKPAAAGSAHWEALQGALMRLFQREGIAETPINMNAARFLLDRDLPLTRNNIERVLFLEGMSSNILKDAFFDRAASHLASDSPIGSMSLQEVAKMAEQQLTMAQSASRTLSMGFDTDMSRNVPANFSMLETDAQRFMRMAGGQVDSVPTGRMAQLFSRLASINPLTVNIHAGIVRGNTPFTINAIHDNVQMARAQSEYEQHATVPNPKHGDTFARVRGQFEPLLKGMNIRPTSENLKASFILSKNDMDVNQDNLQAVKEIDAKISTLADKLHPIIAANMIKEGLNPLEMHVDQVLAYVMKFNTDKGQDVSGKVAQYIMEMDANQSLATDVRKSMIALYRMLHIIQKDGSAALGLAAEIGASMTLGEMMDLAKNFKRIRAGEAVDVQVYDETYSDLKNMIKPDGSIRAALESTAKSDGKWPLSDMGMAMDRFLDAVAPKKLEALLASKDGLNQAVEDLAASVDKPQVATGTFAQSAMNAATAASQQQIIDQVQAFVAANPEVVHFLQSRGLPATIGNIRALEKLTRSSRALAEELEEAEGLFDSEDAEDIFESVQNTSLDDLKKGSSPGQIMARVLHSITRALPGKMADDIESLLAVTHGLNGDGEYGFQLPVKINGRIANLQLYVLNDRALKEDGARVLLSLDTGRLGMVTTYFTLTQDSLDIMVTVQTQEAVDALESRTESFAALLGEAGVGVNSMEIVLDRQPALETSLPPDALQQWSADSLVVQSNISKSTVDMRV